MDDVTKAIIIIIGLMVLIPLYLLPTMLACKRKHHNKTAIILLNILLGWSFLGWVLSLVWSVTSTGAQYGSVSPKPAKQDDLTEKTQSSNNSETN